MRKKIDIVRVTSNKSEAMSEARRINKNMLERKIKRRASVISVSQAYVKTLTRKGFPIKKKNYAIAMRTIK